MLFDKRDITKKIPGHDTTEDPAGATDYAPREEYPPLHLSHPGNKGDVGPKKGDETTEGNCFRPVFFVECTGFSQIFLVENNPILAAKGLMAKPDPHKPVEVVAEYRGNREQGKDNGQVHGTGGAKRANGKKHGIAGKEGRNNQTYLGKNDEGNQTVYPRAVQGDLLGEMRVEVQKILQNNVKVFHIGKFWREGYRRGRGESSAE